MKIAITTFFQHEQNYGALLQAYALCHALNTMGHEAEQLLFNDDSKTFQDKLKGWRKLSLSAAFQRTLHGIQKREQSIYNRLFDPRIQKDLQLRANALRTFRQNITPHSRLYKGKQDLLDHLDDYDCYIAGSDQIWNPRSTVPMYLLEYIPSTKPKIAYAASFGVDHLTAEQLARFRDAVKDYTAISLREDACISQFQTISPVPVVWTVDPTLLLEKADWDQLCVPRIIQEPYLFCYFLGNSPVSRKLAVSFAKEKGLRLVTLPYMQGHYRSCDRNFGDIQLFDTSPQQFITLIRDAEYVFTDSFHATIFSGLYQKQFFVFHRDCKEAMTCRLDSLMKLYGLPERLCYTAQRERLDYLLHCSPINYAPGFPVLQQARANSLCFLQNALHIPAEL